MGKFKAEFVRKLLLISLHTPQVLLPPYVRSANGSLKLASFFHPITLFGAGTFGFYSSTRLKRRALGCSVRLHGFTFRDWLL